MAVTMKAASGAAKSPSWLKSGAAAAQAVNTAEAKAEAAKAEKGKLYSFRLQLDEEATITFLDGDLNEHGMFDNLVNLHTVPFNGKYKDVICTDDIEPPCPVCQGGDRSSLAALLTVIDHREREYQGKVYKNERRLFIAKLGTIKVLTKLAVKRGGLAGCTFEVSRTGNDKTPAVGTMFEFSEKRTLGQLQAIYGPETLPADYAKELVYHSPTELIQLGIGKSVAVIGKKPANVDTSKAEDEL